MAERRGWRLAFVGDPMQFSAVGRSGMFGHLVDALGAVELDRVHRFDASWERDASLRLRRGDTDVVGLYDHHGRLHGGTARQMAIATVHAWRRAIETGDTAAMMAPTREAVALLNEIAQATRFAACEVDPGTPSVRVGPSRAHAGDLVATRRNERTLRTDRGRIVKNRDHWTVEAVHRSGALTVTGPTGRVTLPAEYVAADVELAYAETSHATQGRTVDRSFLLMDGPTDTRGVYVPLTRRRTTNEAFVVLQDERSAAEVMADAVARTWVDQPATALRLDRPAPTDERARSGRGVGTGASRARPREPLPEPKLRSLVKQVAAHQAAADKLRWDLAGHDRAIAALVHRKGDLAAAIESAKARLADATRTLDEHDRPLRRRNHRFKIARARNEVRSLPGQIEDLESEVAVVPEAIEAERTAGERTAKRVANPLRRGHPERVQQAVDDDARVRGERAAEQPDSPLIAQLGPIPDGATAREVWINAAGRIAQHQVLWDVPDDVLIGPLPSAGQDAYAVTFYAGTRAVADLDQALGVARRGPAPSAPGLSL